MRCDVMHLDITVQCHTMPCYAKYVGWSLVALCSLLWRHTPFPLPIQTRARALHFLAAGLGLVQNIRNVQKLSRRQFLSVHMSTTI